MYVFTPRVFTIFGATFVLFDFTYLVVFLFNFWLLHNYHVFVKSDIDMLDTFVYLYEFNTFTTYNVIYDNQFNSVIDKVNPMSLNSRIGAPSFDLFEYLCFLWKHA